MISRDLSLLEDMAAYAEDAVELLGEQDALALELDKRTRYAVIRALEVLGEAASKVSAETRSELQDLPWRQATGLRNVLIHDYSALDLSIVVKVVREELPPLIARIRKVLGDEPE
jgi:uncharacterized protein with HEPN domain